ncbi:hypothetical protein [Diplocloster hominis]|uniref:hypothetical protein n=1 Tax=Diplocloster hominis TaxID=3079010 RepID=UPI0031BB6D62
MIYRNWLPCAIRYGISYETFWDLNPRIMDIYQAEFRRRESAKLDLIDYSAWLNGAYIVNAVQTALSPRKVKYSKMPLHTSKQDTPINDAEKFKLWAAEFNRRFENIQAQT